MQPGCEARLQPECSQIAVRMAARMQPGDQHSHRLRSLVFNLCAVESVETCRNHRSNTGEYSRNAARRRSQTAARMQIAGRMQPECSQATSTAMLKHKRMQQECSQGEVRLPPECSQIAVRMRPESSHAISIAIACAQGRRVCDRATAPGTPPRQQPQRPRWAWLLGPVGTHECRNHINVLCAQPGVT